MKLNCTSDLNRRTISGQICADYVGNDASLMSVRGAVIIGKTGLLVILRTAHGPIMVENAPDTAGFSSESGEIRVAGKIINKSEYSNRY